ncbi:MAG: 5-(carboxyamino)imidazole ribonucleotide synthase [Halodesulfurarchaeum sp.]
MTVPDVTIGVIGGGQLGRMLAESASPLGIEIVVLDPTPSCPASLPAADQIVADFDDASAVGALAERSDVVTLEIELADPDALAATAETTGTPVHPAPSDLRITRDKLEEKKALDAAGVPVPAYRRVDERADLESAFDELGRPLMLKARRGGYDGRGNAVVDERRSAEDVFGSLSGLIAEELLDFERELSVIGAIGDGETATFPVAENVHEAEILRESIVPARTSESVRSEATATARAVLEVLQGRGVFGIELFETRDGAILVNEIAPRPHNSGHYTIEGAVTSQFEQHARAVLGLPLGTTELRAPTVMVNVLGDEGPTRGVSLRGTSSLLGQRGVHFHWYGKREVRPLRKLGHVTVTGSDREDLIERARRARETLTFAGSGD